MGCATFNTKDALGNVVVSGIICGRGAGSPKPCASCGAAAEFQCDAFVTPPGTKPRRRCNRHLCAAHRTPLAPNKDACPVHAPMCLAARERLKLKEGSAA